MRGSKFILLTMVRGSWGSRSTVLGVTCAASRMLRMPATITAIARLGVRKNKWRMRMVKRDMEIAGSFGSM